MGMLPAVIHATASSTLHNVGFLLLRKLHLYREMMPIISIGINDAYARTPSHPLGNMEKCLDM